MGNGNSVHTKATTFWMQFDDLRSNRAPHELPFVPILGSTLQFGNDENCVYATIKSIVYDSSGKELCIMLEIEDSGVGVYKDKLFIKRENH